jgi:hypothetical protein
MRKSALILMIFIFCHLFCNAGNHIYSFDRKIIDYIADNYQPPSLSIGDPEKYYYPIAMARMVKYGENDSIANEYISILGKKGVFHFASIGLIRILYQFGSAPSVKLRLREIVENQFNGNLWESEGTENHLNMERTSAFLIAQLAKDILPERKQETDFRYRQMKNWILTWGNRFLRYGEGEWNSSIYGAYSVIGWLNLYDFSKDEQIVSLAKKVVDKYVEGFAIHYSWGMLGGAEMRGKGISDMNNEATSYFCRLWFDKSDASYMNNIQGSAVIQSIHPILSSYRPLEKFIQMSHKEDLTTSFYIEDIRPSYLYEDTAFVHRSFYADENFTLGSYYANYGGYTGGCSQIIPWKLLIRKRNDSPIQISGNGVYNNDYSAKGACPYTQIAQYKNVLFVLTSVPKNVEKLECSVDSAVVEWKRLWKRDYDIRFPGNQKANVVTRIDRQKINLDNRCYINLPQAKIILCKKNRLIQKIDSVYVIVTFLHMPQKVVHLALHGRIILEDSAALGQLAGYVVEVVPERLVTESLLREYLKNNRLSFSAFKLEYKTFDNKKINVRYNTVGEFIEPLFDWGYGVISKQSLQTSPPMQQPVWIKGYGCGKEATLKVY